MLKGQKGGAQFAKISFETRAIIFTAAKLINIQIKINPVQFGLSKLIGGRKEGFIRTRKPRVAQLR